MNRIWVSFWFALCTCLFTGTAVAEIKVPGSNTASVASVPDTSAAPANNSGALASTPQSPAPSAKSEEEDSDDYADYGDYGYQCPNSHASDDTDAVSM